MAEEAAGPSPTFSFPAWVARTWCGARSSRKPAVTPCRLPGPVARTKRGSEPRQSVVLRGSTAGEQDLCSCTCAMRVPRPQRRSRQRLAKAGLSSGTDPAQDFGVPEQRRRWCLQEGTRSGGGKQRTRAPRPRLMNVGDGSALGPAHTCAQWTSPSPQSCVFERFVSNSVSPCEASPRDEQLGGTRSPAGRPPRALGRCAERAEPERAGASRARLPPRCPWEPVSRGGGRVWVILSSWF